MVEVRVIGTQSKLCGWQWPRGREHVFENGGSRKVQGSILGSPRVSVEESLSTTLNPKLLPVNRLVPCMVSSTIGIQRMNVYMNLYHVSPYVKCLG